MFIILVEFKTAASYFETCSFSDLLQWLWMVKNNLARLVFRSADFLKLYLFVSMSKPEAISFGVTPLDALGVNSRPDRRRAGVGAVTCKMADVIRLLAWELGGRQILTPWLVCSASCAVSPWFCPISEGLDSCQWLCSQGLCYLSESWCLIGLIAVSPSKFNSLMRQ